MTTARGMTRRYCQTRPGATWRPGRNRESRNPAADDAHSRAKPDSQVISAGVPSRADSGLRVRGGSHGRGPSSVAPGLVGCATQGDGRWARSEPNSYLRSRTARCVPRRPRSPTAPGVHPPCPAARQQLFGLGDVSNDMRNEPVFPSVPVPTDRAVRLRWWRAAVARRVGVVPLSSTRWCSPCAGRSRADRRCELCPQSSRRARPVSVHGRCPNLLRAGARVVRTGPRRRIDHAGKRKRHPAAGHRKSNDIRRRRDHRSAAAADPPRLIRRECSTRTQARPSACVLGVAGCSCGRTAADERETER